MKKRKLFLYPMLILLHCLFFCTGCSKEKSPDYAYEFTSKNIRIEEKDAVFMTDLRDVIICRGEHANIDFLLTLVIPVMIARSKYKQQRR